MKRILSILVLGIFLISLASASNLDFVKTDTCAQLYQSCESCTFVNLTMVKIPGTQKSDPMEIDIVGELMNNFGYDFTYEYCNTSRNGDYFYNVCGDKGGSVTCEVITFEVNPAGGTINSPQGYILILILVIIFIILTFSVYGINHAVKAVWQITYICLFYLLIFSFMFLLWVISKNYLYDVPLLESTFWIIWLILSIIFWPFIIIVSSYLLKKEMESLMEEDLVKQGHTPEEAREMSRSKH
jgi:hypothetical protein